MTELIFSNVIIDDERCIEFTKLVSSYDYYKNTAFQYCQRNYIIYENAEYTDDDTMALWEDEVLRNYYFHNEVWFNDNKSKTHWRKDLK